VENTLISRKNTKICSAILIAVYSGGEAVAKQKKALMVFSFRVRELFFDYDDEYWERPLYFMKSPLF
jgi:hypothetical protein